MNEDQLQAACVRKFSELFPEEYRKLWAVKNRTLSEKDGMTQRAMGLKRGVSDLMLNRFGAICGIELKIEGNKHPDYHIKEQYEWGLSIPEYYIVSSVEAFLKVIYNETKQQFPGLYTMQHIEELLLSQKTKNIKIQWNKIEIK